MATTEPLIELDVNDFKSAEEELPTATESSTEEAVVEPAAEDSETDTEGEEAEQSDETAEDTEDEKFKGAEARKEQLTNEIRQLAAQKNDLRREVEQINAQVYRAESADELVARGVDPGDARIQALEQRQAIAEYNVAVSELNFNLNAQAQEVMRDFPMFDPQNPAYNASLAKLATQTWQNAAQVKYDPETKLAVSANVLPYQIYQAFAEAHNTGSQNGKATGQRAAEKMLAHAETTSSSAPKEAEADPFLAGLTKGLKSAKA